LFLHAALSISTVRLKPDTTYVSSRQSLVPSPLLIGQHPLQLRHVDVGDRGRSAQTAFPLRGLAAQDVLLERLPTQELAILRPLEALGGPSVRFQFDLLRLFRHL